MKNIRNFSIIAHIDHGKSTLADRFLEITQTVPRDKLQPQLLDSLALERQRGITIKLAPVRLNYTQNATNYLLNLIDTPGHVDFSYEVSRALAAVEGALLLVDATQGIQAQTLAHGQTAQEQGLTLIPIINKIDLSNADIAGCQRQLFDAFGFRADEIYLASAKTGQGVKNILEAIIEKIPPPKINLDKPFRALVFDSFFDNFRGVVSQIRVVDGKTPPLQSKVVMLKSKAGGQVQEVGYFAPKLTAQDYLASGEIGYIVTGIKDPGLSRVGDTITTDFSQSALPGYKEVKPMVFVGLYPIDNSQYPQLKDALAKFQLNDPAFSYTPENSQALGAGFRCGFLGMLHAEVVSQRLGQEYQIEPLATAPSVEYLMDDTPVHNPSILNDAQALKNIKEPWVKIEIITKDLYLGQIMQLVDEKRGVKRDMQYLAGQACLVYDMPLSEMVGDFYDRLKSASSGFASMDWEFLEYRPVDAVVLNILVAGEKVDALSTVVVHQKAYLQGKKIVEKLKSVLPKQNFEIAIQAAIGGKIIARETISAYKKDVIAKLYGGDRTRKDKLLTKQKLGKKRMKSVGRVEIPQDAFLNIFRS